MNRAAPKFLRPGMRLPGMLHPSGRAVIQRFRDMIQAASWMERIELERHGVPIAVVHALVERMGLAPSEFARMVGDTAMSLRSRRGQRRRIDGAPGHAILGLMALIEKVDVMVESQRYRPGDVDFDAIRWVGEWLRLSQPALGGRLPLELMDTPSGRACVMRALGALQSGSYQ